MDIKLNPREINKAVFESSQGRASYVFYRQGIYGSASFGTGSISESAPIRIIGAKTVKGYLCVRALGMGIWIRVDPNVDRVTQ